MTLEENKQLSRRWIEGSFGRGDVAVMEEMMPLELLEESAFREQIAAYRAGFPDLEVTIDDQLAEGERVMTMMTFRGHHSGDLLGAAPTGRPIEYTMVEIDTIRDGRIVGMWNDFHPVRILQQLGLIMPKPE